MKGSKLYIVIMTLVIIAFTVVLNFFPRSEYSELERRELSKRPAFSLEALTSGEFTKGVSAWYSDTEPYRDRFMTLSMEVRKARALQIGDEDEQITYVASEEDEELASEPAAPAASPDTTHISPVSPDPSAPAEEVSDKAEEYEAEEDTGDFDDRAKITNNGILIIGKEPNVRTLMAYRGKGGGESYARVVNKYQETFGDDVQVYCMVIPTAVEFYCPERAKKATLPESATIDTLYSRLLPSVKQVYLLPVLAAHTDEPIYLRTDHHWSPLGAYYAAQELCRVAGVHVPDLTEFDQRVTRNFVGTMYGFSRDISVKRSPEDFVYYVPRDVTYTTTYTVYDIDSTFQVIGEHRPYQGEYFHHFRDGSGKAYCTFMGGDTKITKVVTSTQNGRKVLILKDSFGNALGGYLFGSFEEVHIIDGRYFTKNMVDYVSKNGITDIVFANNVFKAYAGGRQYLRFLTQNGAITYTPRNNSSPAREAIVPLAGKETGEVAKDRRSGLPADSTPTTQEPDSATMAVGTVFVTDTTTNEPIKNE
ncbi:MAG: hypothetical protein IKN59_01580 [Paludibacteraceae bacterium]|nr:hypothetical protein [Paludibacteraceae bacterium]